MILIKVMEYGYTLVCVTNYNKVKYCWYLYVPPGKRIYSVIPTDVSNSKSPCNMRRSANEFCLARKI